MGLNHSMKSFVLVLLSLQNICQWIEVVGAIKTAGTIKSKTPYVIKIQYENHQLNALDALLNGQPAPKYEPKQEEPNSDF